MNFAASPVLIRWLGKLGIALESASAIDFVDGARGNRRQLGFCYSRDAQELHPVLQKEFYSPVAVGERL